MIKSRLIDLEIITHLGNIVCMLILNIGVINEIFACCNTVSNEQLNEYNLYLYRINCCIRIWYQLVLLQIIYLYNYSSFDGILFFDILNLYPYAILTIWHSKFHEDDWCWDIIIRLKDVQLIFDMAVLWPCLRIMDTIFVSYSFIPIFAVLSNVMCHIFIDQIRQIPVE